MYSFIKIVFFFSLSCFPLQGWTAEAENIDPFSPSYTKVSLFEDFSAYEGKSLQTLSSFDSEPFEKQKSSYDSTYINALKLYKTVPDFSTSHIPGLWDIFKKGIALTRDNFLLFPSTCNKEHLMLYLEAIYKTAQYLNEKQYFTQENFVYMNLGLAYIASSFHDDFRYMALHFNLEDFHPSRLKVFYTGEDSNLSTLWTLRKEVSFTPSFTPPYVIYAAKNIVFSPKKFIEATINPQYSYALLLFDVNSRIFMRSPLEAKGHQGTFSDPHYSFWNGTYFMLLHDLLHHTLQNMVISFLFDKHTLRLPPYYPALKQLEERLSLSDTNKAKIVEKALFILTHELSTILIGMIDLEEQEIFLPRPACFEDLINYISQVMVDSLHQSLSEKADAKSYVSSENNISLLKGRERLTYKIHLQDHERILWAKKDTEGRPFLPKNFKELSTELQLENVADGYRRFWTSFLKLWSNRAAV